MTPTPHLLPTLTDSTSMDMPWTGVIPAADEALYRLAGMGTGQVAMNIRRPALLIIDMQYRSSGEKPARIEDAILEYPTSCGEVTWRAVAHVARLIAVFRAAGFPIVYPHVAPKGRHNGGRFADKMPNIMTISARGYEFIADVAPADTDLVIPKHHASAFFGTPLASHLIDFGVDTLFVVGGTTSGCVRATTVDASSLGFKVIVPHEAVFDRSQTSHAVNLFDMAAKYADVVSVTEAIALLEGRGRLAPSGV
ncbi:hydrolase [Pigmentiphaga litoralis]|uniref:isochorismatase family protein n=1 Tax=Pigmentiphaga litoralis TaxID=516702 RepID=UPI0019ADB322|nr:isochorismatase family protein [Pigmentiphaga litoralis]GGX17599.1 hydrolase [Pigmentiphaga litoralis]